MPIYLDRHDTPEEITPEHVAEMHQADLRVQDDFGCRGFTYWFDDKRKSGFCLIEAPNKEALIKMHDKAHGAVPHQIIEVQEEFVESFLGRLEDPEKAKNQKLNIIDEPAFRTIMLIKHRSEPAGVHFGKNIENYNKVIKQLTIQFEGRIVQQKGNTSLGSFHVVSNAIKCALAINKKLNTNTLELNPIRIALNCGVPVTENKENIFEDTILLADRMVQNISSDIVVSSELKELYDLENVNNPLTDKAIYSMRCSDQEFLNSLMAFVENAWNKPDLKVEDFASSTGLSKSQLYRKLTHLTNKSPNTFLRDYRLNKAIQLLENGENTIAEIAFETGFTSPSYFSKCFQEKYNVLPSSLVN